MLDDKVNVHRLEATLHMRLMHLAAKMAPALWPPTIHHLAATARAPLLVCSAGSMGNPPLDGNGPGFHWAPWVAVRVAALFLISGLAEIGGGWLVGPSHSPAHSWFAEVADRDSLRRSGRRCARASRGGGPC